MSEVYAGVVGQGRVKRGVTDESSLSKNISMAAKPVIVSDTGHAWRALG